MTVITTHRPPGYVLTSHTFQLPLDYAQPDGAQISVFAREVVAPGREHDDLPWLIFFQGGPGGASLRPSDRGGWIGRALQEYRVLLLDQRGTGLSTPVLPQTLSRLSSAQAQAEYLMHFRADNIVRDAEAIRHALVGPNVPWTALGQSFGGFCVLHYLSVAAQGLRGAIFTGGLPPLARHADDVYHATYRRVSERNRLYYERYPEDVARAQIVVQHLHANDVRLPNGDRLTPRRFQQLGGKFGASGGFESVHYLLEQALLPGMDKPEISDLFLNEFAQDVAFEDRPIYAILHEAIYCQDHASNWSAQRVRAEYPEFMITPDKPVYFTGEMIYPWMFEEYGRLRPLRKAADILAAHTEWPRLYDADVLRANRVPCVAAVYYNDMYVERVYSEETAAEINGIKLWVTNEYEHNGLRADGATLLDRLLAMLQGSR